MAGIEAIHSVGELLVQHLNRNYPDELRTVYPCTFSLFGSAQMKDDDNREDTVSLFLYRITYNEHLRTQRTLLSLSDDPPPLSLDLHYMATFWMSSAPAEHVIAAWTMRELNRLSLLDASQLLPTDAGWDRGSSVQFVPQEPTHEDLMRIWDALEPSYRLSICYVARVVRIESGRFGSSKPVLATRFVISDDPTGGSS